MVLFCSFQFQGIWVTFGAMRFDRGCNEGVWRIRIMVLSYILLQVYIMIKPEMNKPNNFSTLITFTFRCQWCSLDIWCGKQFVGEESNRCWTHQEASFGNTKWPQIMVCYLDCLFFDSNNCVIAFNNSYTEYFSFKCNRTIY